jgi:hypothetical protein
MSSRSSLIVSNSYLNWRIRLGGRPNQRMHLARARLSGIGLRLFSGNAQRLRPLSQSGAVAVAQMKRISVRQRGDSARLAVGSESMDRSQDRDG